MNFREPNITKIGVFYDGNYFWHVSNYYNYVHNRKRRISIAGLHNFVRHQVAEEEGTDYHFCHIIDSHYFRGRLNAYEAVQRENQLYFDRVFEDLLMQESVVTHYLPLKAKFGKKEEKGIDVWLALEAYELSLMKKYDVIVLVACDGDYVPLIRKLNGLGVRVMLLSWDFDYTDDTGQKLVTRTSQELLEQVTYPIAMHEMIDNRLKRNDPLINNMFVQQEVLHPKKILAADPNQSHQSLIFSLKNGYGFIVSPPNNLFFHYTDIISGDFNELVEGDLVEYTIGRNAKGEDVAKNVKRINIPDDELEDDDDDSDINDNDIIVPASISNDYNRRLTDH